MTKHGSKENIKRKNRTRWRLECQNHHKMTSVYECGLSALKREDTRSKTHLQIAEIKLRSTERTWLVAMPWRQRMWQSPTPMMKQQQYLVVVVDGQKIRRKVAEDKRVVAQLFQLSRFPWFSVHGNQPLYIAPKGVQPLEGRLRVQVGRQSNLKSNLGVVYTKEPYSPTNQPSIYNQSIWTINIHKPETSHWCHVKPAKTFVRRNVFLRVLLSSVPLPV